MDVYYRVSRESEPCVAEVGYAAAVWWRDCLPMRTPTVHKNTRCKPGRQYVASIGELVSYESLLEAQYLLLADWLGVAWVLPQPMLLDFGPEARPSRHIPDFLVCDTDGVERLVDVCTVRAAGTERRQASHALTTAVCAEVGWTYQVFTGLDPATGKNLRLLAHHSRPHPLAVPLLADVAAIADTHADIGFARLVDLTAVRSGALPVVARAAVMSLLWCRRLLFDITMPLGEDTVLRPALSASTGWEVAA